MVIQKEIYTTQDGAFGWIATQVYSERKIWEGVFYLSRDWFQEAPAWARECEPGKKNRARMGTVKEQITGMGTGAPFHQRWKAPYRTCLSCFTPGARRLGCLSTNSFFKFLAKVSFWEVNSLEVWPVLYVGQTLSCSLREPQSGRCHGHVENGDGSGKGAGL